jgi:hypothetical protein
MDLKTKKPLRKLKNPSKASYGGLLGTPIHTLSREILELCGCATCLLPESILHY